MWHSADALTIASVAVSSYVDFTDTAAPANPSAGVLRLWSEATGGFDQLHFTDSNGLDYQLARDNIHTIRNSTGTTITKGSWVYINGSTGQVPSVALAQTNSATTSPAAGIVTADISNNSFGQMMTMGDAEKINTTAFSDGDILYLSPTVAGEATNVKPTGTSIVHRLGVVVKSSGGAGIIAVLIGGEFNPATTQTLTNKTLPDVTITGGTISGTTVSQSTLTYAATVNLDMAAITNSYQTISLAGDLTLTSSNRAAGRHVDIRLVNSASIRTLTFPTGWVFLGAAKPATISSNAVATLNIMFFGTADTDAICKYSVTP